MADPLHDALRDATLAVLLGSTEVPHTGLDGQGNAFYGTITIGSAFAARLQAQAFKGDFDDLIRQALEQVDVAAVAKAFEGVLAEQFLQGLKAERHFGGRQEPNWLQSKAKQIAVEACTAALKDDEEMVDVLRARIGSEVDRNRVGITVSLSDPERSQ